MNSETKYEYFLEQLRKIDFCTVQSVLKKRDDLEAFRAKSGQWTTHRDPWFGASYGELTEDERESACMEYGYYCGHADDVFYRKPTKSDKRECFMPALSSLLSRQTLPTVGEIIFGHTEEDKRGEGKRRFIWWNFATAQDRNFANLLLGRITYSREKLPRKLVIGNPNGSNWTLFLLAMALHFRDIDYFVDQLQKNGGQPLELNLGCPLKKWLARSVAGIVPEFWKELQRKTFSQKAETPCVSLASSF